MLRLSGDTRTSKICAQLISDQGISYALFQPLEGLVRVLEFGVKRNFRLHLARMFLYDVHAPRGRDGPKCGLVDLVHPAGILKFIIYYNLI